jgi:hypothetical protein
MEGIRLQEEKNSFETAEGEENRKESEKGRNYLRV